MATNAYIQLPPDSTGKQVRSWSSVVDTQTVHSQAITITDKEGAVMADLTSGGRIKSDSAIGGMTPAGAGQMALGIATSTALTVPAGSTMALIQVESNDARWRDDGTAPTSSVGMKLYRDSTYLYTGDLSAVRFISESGAAATLNILYYKY